MQIYTRLLKVKVQPTHQARPFQQYSTQIKALPLEEEGFERDVRLPRLWQYHVGVAPVAEKQW
jgi:hypothetical protein